MYKILTTQDLGRLGFTLSDIRFARKCCLLRLSRGVYVARHVCTVHRHRPLWASIAENAHAEFKRYGDIRDQIEELRAAVMARCELRFQRRRQPPGESHTNVSAPAKTLGSVDSPRPDLRATRDQPDSSTGDPKERTLIEKPEIFSHISAALILGLPIAYPVTHQVEVFRPGVNRRFKSLHVRGNTVPVKHQLMVGGCRVTSIERTLIDVARSYNLDLSVAMIDSALHRNQTSLKNIRVTLSQCLEKRNSRKVQLALDLSDGRRESPAESIAAVRFYQHGIVGFEPQVEFRHESLPRSIRVDFCHRTVRLIVEIDGLGKLYLGSGVPREELEKERRREQWLRDHGYQVIRISWKELFQDRRFEEIKSMLRRSTWAGLG